MTARSRSLHPYLNLYHRHFGLLFQFILSDFFAIHSLVQPLQLKPDFPQCNESYLTILKRLSGSSQDRAHFFIWSREGGLLNKLKTYSALYAQNHFTAETEHALQQNKSILQIQRSANQAWLYTMHGIDLLYILRERENDSRAVDSFCKTMTKLFAALQRISKAFLPILESFRNDENVLFFLLRYHKQMHEVYGHGFLAQLFAKMHPEGVEQLQTFMLERFTKRGFSHLLPKIKAEISLLVSD